MNHQLMSSLASLCVIATLVTTVNAQTRVYWTDESQARIRSMNPNGTDPQDVITGLVSPLGLTADLTAGKIYRTDWGTDKIQRANLDGTGIEDVISTGLAMPVSVAVDSLGGKLYWTDTVTDKIQRANLDGTGIEDLVTTGLDVPRQIALDPLGGHMYWGDTCTGGTPRCSSGPTSTVRT